MLAVFYNTCGISGKDNTDYYVDCLENILKQNYEFKLVLSSCLNSDEHINKLRNHFGNRMSYSIIQEKLTVNVTFNKAVQEFVKEFGEAERYLYIDSGCNLVDPDTFSYMVKPEYADYGMVSCLTDTDTGCSLGVDTVLPVGTAINLHVQTFHNDIFKRFGRIIPDIFRSTCTESVFPFVNSSVGKEWLVLTEKRIPHEKAVDGPSSGFSEQMSSHDLFVNCNDMINDQEGTTCGFGYEECNGVKMHNPDAYEGNKCKDPERLAKFLHNNIFLNDTFLNYERINHRFIR